MAKGSGPEKSLDEIRQEIAHSRDRMARDLTGLSYELDFPLKFRKSFQRNTITWISAAVLTGVVFMARLPGGKKSVKIDAPESGRKKGREQRKGLLEAGLTMGLLRFAAAIAKPIAVKYVTNAVGGYTRPK
jgi:hypothetical protein